MDTLRTRSERRRLTSWSTRLLMCCGMTAGLLVGSLGAPLSASADNDRHERRGDHREHGRRIERHDDRRDHGPWRQLELRDERWRGDHWRRVQRFHDRWYFERHRGWRYEVRPGFWSPSYFWWRVNGQVVLRPVPTVTVVEYPYGRYVLRGDGLAYPYYWEWVPTVAVPPPPPPPPPAESYPVPPPPPPPPPAG